MNMAQEVSIRTPDTPPHESFTDPKKAVERLQELYATAVKFLSENFVTALSDGQPETRVRAFYPEIRLTTTTYAKTDTRLSFGHVAEPGIYATTITRPDLFAAYLEQQIGLLMQSHGVPVVIGASATEMPVHFAAANDPGPWWTEGVCGPKPCASFRATMCVRLREARCQVLSLCHVSVGCGDTSAQ